jgi:hypothetical protein
MPISFDCSTIHTSRALFATRVYRYRKTHERKLLVVLRDIEVSLRYQVLPWPAARGMHLRIFPRRLLRGGIGLHEGVMGKEGSSYMPFVITKEI